MNQIDFLQQVALKANELQAQVPKASTKEWKLNYKMLFNPKLHCPFCEEWIESGRVWIVDEENTTVKRVWKLDGTKINVDGCHPHVGFGGKICMGNARSISDALIAGIAGRDDFIRAWDWFPEQLGHSCSVMDEARKNGGFNRHADDPFEDDHEGESYCDSCDEYYNEDDTYFCDRTDRTYCENCWGDSHDFCEDCSGEIHTHADETSYEVEGRYGTKYVCEVCYMDDYFTCTECDKGLRYEKHQEDGVCMDCWAETHFVCEECSGSFPNMDKFDDDQTGIQLLICPNCCFVCVKCTMTCTPDERVNESEDVCKTCGEEASNGE